MAMKKEIFNMGMPWESGYGYSQAVKVGDTIYVSGQVDHDEAGKVLYPGAKNAKCARLIPTSKESSPTSALRWTT